MIRIIYFITLFFVTFITSCQLAVKSERQIASSEKTGRHYIVTLHGFNGGADSFGQIEKVLIPHLKELRPQTDYKLLQFLYPTGSDTDVFDFAYNHLSRFLNEKIKNPTENDSLIFVAHSQGGIIATVWKAAAQYGLVKDQKYQNVLNDKIYAQITDQVITLGTPFWGANTARLGLDLNIMKSGFHQELQGMVFNSELILWMRYLAVMMKGSSSNDLTEYSNIAGILPSERNKMFYQKELIRGGKGQAIADIANTVFKGIVRRHSFSSEKINSRQPDRFESDLTVLVPSTRGSFYYADKKITCDQSVVQSEDFSLISLFKPAQYILTEGFHSALASPRTRGISNIPLFCLNAEKCTHPTYRYLLKMIANCKNQTCNSTAQSEILDTMFKVNKVDSEYNQILTAGLDLQGFSLDLNFLIPADYELPEKYYSDQPYTESENAEVDADGEEIYVTRRKTIPLRDRNMREKKLAREILKLDGSILGQDLKEMFDIRIIRRREGMSGLTCWGKVTKCPKANELRLHITGWIKPKSLEVIRKYQTTLAEKYQDGFTLPITIQLPSDQKYNFKKITLLSRVRPGYSTFAKLNFLDVSNCVNKIALPELQQ